MFKLLGRADSWLDVLLRWGTAFAAAWAGFSWLATQMRAFGNIGWAEAIALGLGGAMLLSLVVSLALIAVRYFRPIQIASKDPIYSDPLEDDNIQTSIGKIADSLHALGSDVSEVTSRVEDFSNILVDLQNSVDLQDSKIEGLKWSILAIYHRERMLELAQKIDVLGSEVGLKNNIDQRFDDVEFENWEIRFLEWRSIVSAWSRYASFYANHDVMNDIERLDEAGLREDWGVNSSQFPDEGLVKYKTFRIYLRNWSYVRDAIHQKVRAQAFEGQQTNTRRHYGF
jgi:hypothetical protein